MCNNLKQGTRISKNDVSTHIPNTYYKKNSRKTPHSGHDISDPDPDFAGTRDVKNTEDRLLIF
ncbi:MAG: hypothetical protein LBQ31_03225 [Bacteroidales bacterium]|nr:hypothetical protein [Bacteroidales bacterium]